MKLPFFFSGVIMFDFFRLVTSEFHSGFFWKLNIKWSNKTNDSVNELFLEQNTGRREAHIQNKYIPTLILTLSSFILIPNFEIKLTIFFDSFCHLEHMHFIINIRIIDSIMSF